MRRILTILVFLSISMTFLGCNNTKSDPDIDKMVSISCEIFWWEGKNMDLSKMEEISKIWEKIEIKFKWKRDEYMKLTKSSFQKQCPKIYKQMKKNGVFEE